jgi:hypothetical protein
MARMNFSDIPIRIDPDAPKNVIGLEQDGVVVAAIRVVSVSVSVIVTEGADDVATD